MNITVFGASGRVGQLVVADALARGHSVTAFTHNNSPFGSQDRLLVLTGDITDNEAVAKALNGSDAVISTLGSWHTKSKDIVSAGMKTILPAMEQGGIKRIITLTGTAAIASSDKTTLLDRLSHAFLALVAPKILHDGEEHLRLLEASSAAWTCVRSPAMSGGSNTGYRFSMKLAPLWVRVPRAAVARAIVDQLDDSTRYAQAPVIYSASKS